MAIARAIVSDPTFLLCDEPTGDLDRKSADEIMALIEELVEQAQQDRADGHARSPGCGPRAHGAASGEGCPGGGVKVSRERAAGGVA